MIRGSSLRRLELLLIEDNPGEARLIQEGLRECRVATNLHLASDGITAMSFLRQEGERRKAPRPDMIVLDLSLPHRDGWAILREIKGDIRLRLIPVIVLSSSGTDDDVESCYALHANCYLSKPTALPHLLQLIQSIERFWFTCVTLPPNTTWQR